MDRIRSILDACQLLKADDPETPVTVGMLRRLIAEGKVPCIRNGRKIFLNYDALLDYLSGSRGGTEHEETDAGGIRPVPVKLK